MGGVGSGGAAKKMFIAKEGGGGSRFPLAFMVLVFLKRAALNWTYWPTNSFGERSWAAELFPHRSNYREVTKYRDNTHLLLRGGEREEDKP